MSHKVGKLLVVEEEDDDDDAIVFPSKILRPPSSPSKTPSSPSKLTTQAQIDAHGNLIKKANPKKRLAPSELSSTVPTKKGKITSLVTEEPQEMHVNFNEDLTRILAELGETEKNKGQLYKWRAYNQAVNSLKVHPKRIESGAEAKVLPGIGVKIAKKIQEILDTGHLKRLEADQADPKLAALNLISKVTGIGPKLAKKLVYDDGISTLEELRKISSSLNHHQQLGLKYFDDFEKRVPREEMDKWNAILKQAATEVDPELIAAICGSYRRGLPSSGDVDVLLTHPKFTMRAKEQGTTFRLMERLVDALKRSGYITDEMGCGPFKFMGVCRLHEDGAVARRLDLKLFPLESYAAGLLHFTGSGEYNRQLRGIAIQKGYKLSEYGIYKVDGNGETLIPVDFEEDIFKILGVPFRTPEQRSL